MKIVTRKQNLCGGRGKNADSLSMVAFNALITTSWIKARQKMTGSFVKRLLYCRTLVRCALFIANRTQNRYNSRFDLSDKTQSNLRAAFALKLVSKDTTCREIYAISKETETLLSCGRSNTLRSWLNAHSPPI